MATGFASNQKTFQSLISKSSSWESNLDIGMTTLDAAIEHDLKFEEILNNLENSKDYYSNLINDQSTYISHLQKEISLLKSQLKVFIFVFNFMRTLLKPILLLKYLRKVTLDLCNKLFNILIRFKVIRYYLTTKRGLFMINLILRTLTGNSNIDAIQIQNRFNKLINRDSKYINHNKKLLLHYLQSSRSKKYKDLLIKRK